METTRENVMRSSSVRRLTKDILRMAEKLDAVDAYFDTKLALEILRQRKDQALGR